MIEFDEEFKRELEQQEKMFDNFKAFVSDPVIKELIMQLAKGLAVTVTMAAVRQAWYLYQEYQKTKA